MQSSGLEMEIQFLPADWRKDCLEFLAWELEKGGSGGQKGVGKDRFEP